MNFEDKVRKFIHKHFATRSEFSKSLISFDKNCDQPVGFNQNRIANVFRRDGRNGFRPNEQRAIREFATQQGYSWDESEALSGTEDQAAFSGSYLMFYDIVQDPPDGHSDILYGRRLSISGQPEVESTYKFVLDSGKETDGLVKLECYSSPNYVRISMTEPAREGPATTFLAIKILMNGERILYGNATGFNGDMTSDIVSTRAIALPSNWFSTFHDIHISPESMGADVFGKLAEFLRTDIGNNPKSILTRPEFTNFNGKKLSLAQHCQEIKRIISIRGFTA